MFFAIQEMTSIAGAFVINGEPVVQVEAQDEALPVFSSDSLGDGGT